MIPTPHALAPAAASTTPTKAPPPTTTTTTPTTPTMARAKSQHAAPRHLLVCVDVQDNDGCDLAHALVDHVAGLASALGARVTVFSVVPPLVTPAAPPLGSESAAYRSLVDVATLQSEGWHRVVHTLAERLRLLDVNAESRVMDKDGDAADAIAAVAKDVDADLVVVASHSRKGIAHAVLGSVAERVARRSPAPVLVVPRALLAAGHAVSSPSSQQQEVL